MLQEELFLVVFTHNYERFFLDNIQFLWLFKIQILRDMTPN